MLVEIDLIEVPTLRFSMGSDRLAGHPDDDEGPVREVTVGRMVVSPTPITVAQFDRFVTDTGFETVAEREGSGFVRRFPEHELIAGATWRTPGGPDSPRAEESAWVSQVSWTDARAFCTWSGLRLLTEAEWERIAREPAVAIEPPLENTWEWCADYYDATFHRDEQRVNPTGPHHGTKRVARGGSDRLTQRAAFYPDLGAADLTFRVCRSGGL